MTQTATATTVQETFDTPKLQHPLDPLSSDEVSTEGLMISLNQYRLYILDRRGVTQHPTTRRFEN